MAIPFIGEGLGLVPSGFTPNIFGNPGQNPRTPIDWRRHIEICQQKAEGTGYWIFQAPEFRAWLDDPGSSRLLWLNGGPCTGKTFLASTIIEFLHQRTSEGAVLLFVYLDNHAGSIGNGLRALNRKWNLFKLLSRLLREMEYAFSALFNEEMWEGIRAEKNAEILLATFVEAFTRWPHPIYIVLDGLDHYSLKAEEVELLLKHLGSLPRNVRLLVTSRRAVGFTRVLGQCGAASKGVEPTREDIEQYIHHRVGAELVRFAEQEKDIATKIMEMMEGTMSYPLAYHLLNAIIGDKHIQTTRDLRAALRNLPGNQDAIWHHTLYLIGQQDEVQAADAQKALTWLLPGPLSVDNLQFSMSVAPGRGNPREYFQPGAEVYLVDICRGLIDVKENDSGAGNIIDVVDFTDKQLRPFLDGYLRDADAFIAAAFIDFLSDPERRFTLSYCENEDLTEEDFMEDERWLILLSVTWELRVHPQEDLIVDELYNYLKDEDRAGFLLMLTGRLPEDRTAPYSIWAAVEFELYLTLLELLRNGVVWVPDAGLDEELEGRTFLHIAAEYGGVEDFAPYLTLDNLTSIDVADNLGRTPFSYAAGTGGLDIVIALLSTGIINVNSRDNDGRTPLSHAVELREWDGPDVHEAQINTVDLLLKQQGNHLNINDQDNTGRTALSYAADLDCGEKAQVKLVGRLLEVPGIDLTLEDEDHLSPLDYANQKGNTAVAALLTGQVVQQPFMSSWLANPVR